MMENNRGVWEELELDWKLKDKDGKFVYVL